MRHPVVAYLVRQHKRGADVPGPVGWWWASGWAVVGGWRVAWLVVLAVLVGVGGLVGGMVGGW